MASDATNEKPLLKLSDVKRQNKRSSMIGLLILALWVISILLSIYLTDSMRGTPREWIRFVIIAVCFLASTGVMGWAMLSSGRRVGPRCPFCHEAFVWIDPGSQLGKGMRRRGEYQEEDEYRCSNCGEVMIDPNQ